MQEMYANKGRVKGWESEWVEVRPRDIKLDQGGVLGRSCDTEETGRSEIHEAGDLQVEAPAGEFDFPDGEGDKNCKVVS